MFSSTVLSMKCFSCQGNLFNSCENTTSEIECQPSGSRSYDSCFTVTKTSDFPLIGRRVETIKNCSVLKDCGFLQSLYCYNHSGIVENCFIKCCTGNLCNDNTLKHVESPVTRLNFITTITYPSLTRATRSQVTIATPGLPGQQLTSSSMSRIYSASAETGMSTGWTSASTPTYTFSRDLVQPPLRKTNAPCGGADRSSHIYSSLPTVILFGILSVGAIIEGL